MPVTIPHLALSAHDSSATQKKGTAMTTKTTRTAKTAAAEKETAMPKTDETAKPKGQDAVRILMDERTKLVRRCRRAHKSADLIAEPVNFITGRPLNKDAKVVDDLRFIAAEYGWTDNRFATAGQIAANGGKLPKDAKYDVMFFAMGDKFRYYKVYNFADIEWPDGKMPTELKKSGKRAAKPKAKTAKTDTKLAAEVADLKSLVAQLAQQNAALLAALSA